MTEDLAPTLGVTAPGSRTQADEVAIGRDRILAAALRLFAEKGFEGASFRRIAAEAGVSSGLIRKHFGSKAGLRAAVERAAFEPFEGYLADFEARIGTPDLVTWGLEDSARRLVHDLPTYVLLRRAVLDGGPASDRLLLKYLDEHRRFFRLLIDGGVVSSRIDRTWGPLIQMFVSLGPVLARSFTERVVGGSLTDLSIARGLKQTWAIFLTEHCVDRQDLRGSVAADAMPQRSPRAKRIRRGYGSGRDRLIDTSLRLVARRGWSGVSLRQIGDACGVSYALVRIHFGSKDGLRRAVDDHVMGVLERTVASAVASAAELEASEPVGTVLGVVSAALAEHSVVCEYLVRAVLEDHPTGEAFLRLYYDLHRSMLCRAFVAADSQARYDPVWTPLITLFASLGPTLFGRFLGHALGISFSDPRTARAFQRASRWLLTRPVSTRSSTPAKICARS